MNIISNNLNISLPKLVKTKEVITSYLQNKTAVDTVSFSANVKPEKMAGIKMEKLANQILKDNNFQPKQQIKITATKEFIPFMEVLQKIAYKQDSGKIEIEIIEPEIEKLMKKYGAKPFDYVEKNNQRLKENGAIFIEFNKDNNPFELAKLSKKELSTIQDLHTVDIPKNIQKDLEIDTKDVIHTMLNLREGQPVRIAARREHEPNILRLAEEILKNGAKNICVEIGEDGDNENNFARNMIKYASDEVLEAYPQKADDKLKEFVAKGTALLTLRGNNPDALAGLDQEKSSKLVNAQKPLRKKYMSQLTTENQWCIYGAPTTLSISKAYAKEIKEMGVMEALKVAAKESKEIARKGKFSEHVTRLQKIANKVNSLNLKEIRYTSVDPETKKPNGMTNLTVGLTDVTKFMAAGEKTSTDKRMFYPNVPTEEAFASPSASKVNGVVEATLPLVYQGVAIEGMKLEFKDGEVVKASSDTNEKTLLNLLEMNKEDYNSGARKLGEIALVAGSPIFDTGRVFYDTLYDENATCHLALGNTCGGNVEFPDDCDTSDKKDAYCKEHDTNVYPENHTDFMIGGPNVKVEGVSKDGKVITLIEDNKFQIAE